MRLNKFIAQSTGKSRREADVLIEGKQIELNGEIARIGSQVDDKDIVKLNGQRLSLPTKYTLVMLNKPIGYVSSKRAQAKDVKTLYSLLPPEYKDLKTVGRLDQNSSGLILLTNDGDFAFKMTHPKFTKIKIYLVKINRPLSPLHHQMISDFGVDLEDGKSQLFLEKMDDYGLYWRVTMHEGRNRQIRRTFRALGYEVIDLHRTNFDKYQLGNLESGHWKKIENVL